MIYLRTHVLKTHVFLPRIPETPYIQFYIQTVDTCIFDVNRNVILNFI